MLAVYVVSGRRTRVPMKSSPTATLEFPQRGVFRYHVANETTIADPNTALLFHPDQSYRIIHPNDDGDDCVAGLDAVCAGPTSPACAPFVRWPRTMLSNGKNRRSCAVTGDEHRSADAARIEAIRERLAADLSAKHSLATLARAAALSPFYLARLFRAHTGSSLHQYLLALRLARLTRACGTARPM